MPRKRSPELAEAKGPLPFPSKQDILSFIQSSSANIGRREIARAFNIKGSGRIELKRILKELAADGLIANARKGLRKSEQLPSVSVIAVKGTDRNGDLWAVPLHWDEEEDGAPPHILVVITRRYEGPAIGVGDHVLARLEELPQGEETRFHFRASPIKRLPRDKPRQLGLLRKAGRGFIVESIDKKDRKEWPVAGETDGAADGDLVRFDLMRDAARTGRSTARIIERLGHPQGERAISMIAVHNHGLRDAFPDEVLAELRSLPKATAGRREDLTRVPLVTIDPEDAKDHDDAVWAAPDDNPANAGGHVVIVAIADVSFYVRPGSALDHEARLRGNSVYFPDRVVPMLPERLSNDLCSLRERELRPCLAVRMVFDKAGGKLSHQFMRATMRSAAKLSYSQAQRAIDGSPDDTTQPLLEPVLKPLWAAYGALKAGRERRAPLELDLPERKIKLDERGRVARVVTPERLDAHKPLEEFMIQANVAAAEALEARKSALIYRVHDAPSAEKLLALSEFLASLGLSSPKSGVVRPSQLNRILARVEGMEYQELLNEVILRSQAQAEYSTANLGHFGLNLRRYAHFTSPIRRYADLVVHRALVRAYGLGEGGLSPEEEGKLHATAETISQSERKAMAAERETVDRLIAMHLAERTGETFAARISGVARAGLFVKLNEIGADGFIPAASLGRDYYRHVESAHALVGERTGEVYRLGDAVEVRLIEANPSAGALRFDMLSDGRRVPEVARLARRGGRGRPKAKPKSRNPRRAS